jgi:DNA-binding transcriptional ArsR family regulator
MLAPTMVPLPAPVAATVALEPVYNILMSMVALQAPDDYGGLDEWAILTHARLDEVVRARHQLLFRFLWLDALTNVVERGPATADFPAYLAALAAQPPVVLRDTLLYWIWHSPHLQLYAEGPAAAQQRPGAAARFDPALILADYASYVDQLTALFGEPLDEPVPRAIYELWINPAVLQTTLVDHLRLLWETTVATEWVRIEPRLQATVDAFQQLPLHGLTMLEAMQAVTGRDLRPIFRLGPLLAYRRVRFIPHLHNGPYILWFGDDEELRIGFPAHQPPVPPFAQAHVDASTLVNRAKALADETRLAILWALRDAGQLSTQELIDRFALDKSAASRHLRQLVATSLLEERRVEGAKKVYALNPQAIDELVRLLQGLRG